MKIDLRIPLIVVATVIPAAALTAEGGFEHPVRQPRERREFFVNQRPASALGRLFHRARQGPDQPALLNCHPAGDRPRQGDTARLHQPPVERGADGFGLPALRCPICHQAANFEPARMPGNPIWHLAPRAMGWEGKTLGEICAQIKDPARNGDRSLETLVEHIGEDHLVGWAWAPGSGRAPAPGTQKEAGALVAAWVQTGAACPNP